MKIEALKKKAREHEQREEWGEAMNLYTRALERASEQDDSAIALHNRMGDLQVRIGDLEGAIESYERAIELYLDADLANNAMAVCRKLERNAPDRPSVRLRMGQIRARQGFVVDARQDFVAYAELRLAEGDHDGALRALEEFAALAPKDPEIRVFLAEHLHGAERRDDAIKYLRQAYRGLLDAGEEARADEVRARAAEIAPDADLDTPFGEGEEEPSDEPAESRLPGFESTSLSGLELDAPSPAPRPETSTTGPTEAAPGTEDEPPRVEREADPADDASDRTDEGEPMEVPSPFELDDDLPGAEAGPGAAPLEEAAGGSEGEVPAFVEEDPAGAQHLPGPGEDDPVEGSLEPLPLLDEEAPAPGTRTTSGSGAGSTPEPDPGLLEPDPFEEPSDATDPEELRRRGVELLESERTEEGREALRRAHRAYGDAGEPERAMRVVRELIAYEPDSIEHHQRLVEYAHRTGDRGLLIPAFLELAETLERRGARRKAEAVYGQVLALDPRDPRARAGLAVDAARGGGSFVDLGGMILDEPGETSFRWKISDADPSGDEDADFAKMLSQFKEKVAENLPSDDATAHYDLGAAYKDMGLLDEAVGQFQDAIRAHPSHLAAYEMVGQCFLDQGRPEVAVRTLLRALDVEHQVEDELLGIYYYLGQAYEEVGDVDAASEYYERVFSLDINFEDVTERLRALR